MEEAFVAEGLPEEERDDKQREERRRMRREVKRSPLGKGKENWGSE